MVSSGFVKSCVDELWVLTHSPLMRKRHYSQELQIDQQEPSYYFNRLIWQLEIFIEL